MGLEDDFETAAEEATTILPNNITNDEKKILYALFKQAKFGDNNTQKPGLLNLLAKHKWEAWNEQKGKSKEDAMREYIAKVEELKGKYVRTEAVVEATA